MTLKKIDEAPIHCREKALDFPLEIFQNWLCAIRQAVKKMKWNET